MERELLHWRRKGHYSELQLLPLHLQIRVYTGNQKNFLEVLLKGMLVSTCFFYFLRIAIFSFQLSEFSFLWSLEISWTVYSKGTLSALLVVCAQRRFLVLLYITVCYTLFIYYTYLYITYYILLIYYTSTSTYFFQMKQK